MSRVCLKLNELLKKYYFSYFPKNNVAVIFLTIVSNEQTFALHLSLNNDYF